MPGPRSVILEYLPPPCGPCRYVVVGDKPVHKLMVKTSATCRPIWRDEPNINSVARTRSKARDKRSSSAQNISIAVAV